MCITEAFQEDRRQVRHYSSGIQFSCLFWLISTYSVSNKPLMQCTMLYSLQKTQRHEFTKSILESDQVKICAQLVILNPHFLSCKMYSNNFFLPFFFLHFSRACFRSFTRSDRPILSPATIIIPFRFSFDPLTMQELDQNSPLVQKFLTALSESELMDFVEIWADQRGPICQRLNEAKIDGITFGATGGLKVHSIWHVWESEELSELRGGWFQHSKITARDVLVPFPYPVHSVTDLEEALLEMKRIAKSRTSPFSAP